MEIFLNSRSNNKISNPFFGIAIFVIESILSETSIRRRRQKLQVEEIWEWKIQLSISENLPLKGGFCIQYKIVFPFVLYYITPDFV